jgi:hypothetical protein
MAKWFVLLFVPVIVGSLAMAVGFSWKQAVLLAILAAYVERGLSMSAAKPTHIFEPYYVRIFPNWDQIITDYLRIHHEEDWQKFSAWREGKALPADCYSVLRNDKDGVIIYRGSELGFRTAIDWNNEVKKTDWLRVIKKDGISPEDFPNSMDFFVKQYGDVIQLGLRVSEDWWKKFSLQCPESVEVETHEAFLFGLVKIVLVQLPIREFDLYWNEIDYKMEKIDKTWKSVRESRKKYGWEEIKEKESEIPSSWQPIRIKHKYFEVWHRSLR